MAPRIVSNRQLLTYSRELKDGIPLYMSSNSFPRKAERLEPAGAAFHAAALRSLGYDSSKKNEEEEAEFNRTDNGFKPCFDSYSNSKRKKHGGGQDQQDYYSLLGLSNLRYLATEDEIRRSYKEAALRHHPDKQGSVLLGLSRKAAEAKRKEIEERFKSIQEAYEVLIDPVKRRIYDSTDEFDDEVPSDCAPQDYFKVFGPAFVRNGRWSMSQPVPVLGDDNTPVQDVDEFFHFWYNFKSWREFPHADDFDLDHAENREHKRWMERQNAKLREKARKDEKARIRSLVDNAYKRDPRMIRRKEEEKMDKLRKKEAKLQAKRMEEEAAARIAEEERLRKEAFEKKVAEEAAALRRIKEKGKKLLRKERARLRGLSGLIVSEKLLKIGEEDVENLCMSLDIDRMRNLCGRAEQREGLERARLLKDVLEGRDDCTEPYVPRAVEEKGSSQARVNVKTVEQNGALDGQFDENRVKQNGSQGQGIDVTAEQNGTSPSETADAVLEQNSSLRAQSGDEMIKQHCSLRTPCSDETVERNGSSQDVCIHGPLRQHGSAETRSIPEGGLGEKVEGLLNGGQKEKPWSGDEIELLRNAAQKFPEGTSKRLELIADYVGNGRPLEEVSNAIMKFVHRGPDDSKVSGSLIENGKPVDIIQPTAEDLKVDSYSGNGDNNVKLPVGKDNGISEEQAGDAKIQTPDKKEPSGGKIQSFSNGDVAETEPQDEWSAILENALIQALKIFPKDMSRRWDKIAAAVPGKTKAQCMKKFAAMKDNFRTKNKLMG